MKDHCGSDQAGPPVTEAASPARAVWAGREHGALCQEWFSSGMDGRMSQGTMELQTHA